MGAEDSLRRGERTVGNIPLFMTCHTSELLDARKPNH